MRSPVSGVVALATLAALSGFASAGPRHHQNSISYERTGSIPDRQEVGPFLVVRVDSLDHLDATSVGIMSSPQAVEALQRSIRSNPALVAQLEKRGVNIKNVVAKRTTMNGSAVYYVH